METDVIQYTCPVCLVKRKPIEIPCIGAEERNESLPVIYMCACTSPIDFYCNCGNPCKN